MRGVVPVEGIDFVEEFEVEGRGGLAVDGGGFGGRRHGRGEMR